MVNKIVGEIGHFAMTVSADEMDFSDIAGLNLPSLPTIAWQILQLVNGKEDSPEILVKLLVVLVNSI